MSASVAMPCQRSALVWRLGCDRRARTLDLDGGRAAGEREQDRPGDGCDTCPNGGIPTNPHAEEGDTARAALQPMARSSFALIWRSSPVGARSVNRAHSIDRKGLGLGIAAYGLWGVLPIYFKALRAVPSVDIVAHRIVWSVPILALLLSVAGAWKEAGAALRNRRAMLFLSVTALLIGGNWLLYVYAVNSGHILAGSLGYYLNPLANVAAWPDRPQGTAVSAAMGGGCTGRRRDRGPRRGRPRPAVDQPRALPELRELRPPAEDRACRRSCGTGDRDDAAGAVRCGLAGLELQLRAADLRQFFERRHADRDRRRRDDRPATSVHGGSATPALFHARHASVPRADPSVPDRRPALRGTVHDARTPLRSARSGPHWPCT